MDNIRFPITWLRLLLNTDATVIVEMYTFGTQLFYGVDLLNKGKHVLFVNVIRLKLPLLPLD